MCVLSGCKASPPSKFETVHHHLGQAVAVCTRQPQSELITGNSRKHRLRQGKLFAILQFVPRSWTEREWESHSLLICLPRRHPWRPRRCRPIVTVSLNGSLKTGCGLSGMPASKGVLTDSQIWSIVLYLRHLTPPGGIAPAEARPEGPSAAATYVGSKTCEKCHTEIYHRWQKTPMANVVRDPREHPEAILAAFSKPDPLVKFKKEDVAFVYGSLWKQRFFTKVGNDYFPEGAQSDVMHKMWRPYFAAPGTDWWIPFYPADNMKRPTGPTCDGCHSVNYNVHEKSVTEWNVGCERCHGPGSEHVSASHAWEYFQIRQG